MRTFAFTGVVYCDAIFYFVLMRFLVASETLRRIVAVFDELREHTDAGLLSYPFSTREQVNIVRHLQVLAGPSVQTASWCIFLVFNTRVTKHYNSVSCGL